MQPVSCLLSAFRLEPSALPLEATVLNETEKRKPEFNPQNCAPVVLADGQTWYLPKPWLQIHAAFEAGKAVSTYPALTYGAEIDDLITAVGECQDNAAVLCAAASLGAYLLRQNYDLTDQELDTLFAFRLADSISWNWAKEVMQVATGTAGPKASSGGGA
jgi:hypothetical protein